MGQTKRKTVINIEHKGKCNRQRRIIEYLFKSWRAEYLGTEIEDYRAAKINTNLLGQDSPAASLGLWLNGSFKTRNVIYQSWLKRFIRRFSLSKTIDLLTQATREAPISSSRFNSRTLPARCAHWRHRPRSRNELPAKTYLNISLIQKTNQKSHSINEETNIIHLDHIAYNYTSTTEFWCK